MPISGLNLTVRLTMDSSWIYWWIYWWPGFTPFPVPLRPPGNVMMSGIIAGLSGVAIGLGALTPGDFFGWKGSMEIWLVVTGTMEFYDFPYIGNVIIPTDELHHFSERLVGTTNQRYAEKAIAATCYPRSAMWISNTLGKMGCCHDGPIGMITSIGSLSFCRWQPSKCLKSLLKQTTLSGVDSMLRWYQKVRVKSKVNLFPILQSKDVRPKQQTRISPHVFPSHFISPQTHSPPPKKTWQPAPSSSARRPGLWYCQCPDRGLHLHLSAATFGERGDDVPRRMRNPGTHRGYWAGLIWFVYIYIYHSYM